MQPKPVTCVSEFTEALAQTEPPPLDLHELETALLNCIHELSQPCPPRRWFRVFFVGALFWSKK